MPVQQESINRELYGILKSRGYRPDMYTSAGKKVAIPDEAEVFQFDFIKDGENYGKVTASIDGLHRLVLYYGADVASSPKSAEDGESFTHLLKHLKRFAKNKQLGFELSDQDDLEPDMAKREHTKSQGLNEAYYAMGKKASYSDNVPTTKIILQHTKQIEEGEQRYRNIAKIFVENANGERFLVPTNKPGLARVYARHIAEGGTPYDERGHHITSLCEEYGKMAGFVRATRNKQFNESAQKLVVEGISHYNSLRETLHKMSGKRGYTEYFNNYNPPLMEDEEQTDLSEMFMSSSLDPRIESVMPILSKLSKNITETAEIAEVKELEEWADSVTEGDVGVAEGEGNFEKAIGNLHGWYEQESSDPDTKLYNFDDQEGGYYAGGTIEHNLKTGQITIDFEDTSGQYGGEDIKQTFNSIGDAMNVLRQITTQHRYNSGKAPKHDTLASKSLAGPDDLYKTDRAGKKGTLTKDRMAGMKASSQYTMRGGPKGMLPEQGVEEGRKDRDDDLIGGRYTQDEWDQMVNRLKQLAHKQEAEKKAKQTQQKPEQKTDEGLDANQKSVNQLGPTEKITKSNPTRGKLVGANESTELVNIRKLSGL